MANSERDKLHNLVDEQMDEAEKQMPNFKVGGAVVVTEFYEKGKSEVRMRPIQNMVYYSITGLLQYAIDSYKDMVITTSELALHRDKPPVGKLYPIDGKKDND